MLRQLLIAITIVGGFALQPFTARPPSAWADTPTATATGSGSGSAVTVPMEPSESVSFVVKLWRNGAITPAIIVALFVLGSILSKRVAWLSKGHAAAYMASGLAGLTVLIEPAARGTTPNASMFITAVATALALFLNPKKPDTTGTSPPS